MNLGPTELIVILVIVLIIFGAGRLPQVFSSLGKGVREFRDASEGREEVSSTTTTTVTPPGAAATVPPAPAAAQVTQQETVTRTEERTQ